MGEEENSTAVSTVTIWAKNAFDNDATPFFALIICLWGKLHVQHNSSKDMLRKAGEILSLFVCFGS